MPFAFLPGEEFDPKSETFRNAMVDFIKRGGSAESQELTSEERKALNEVMSFATRDTRRPGLSSKPIEGGTTTIPFPKLMTDYAKNWRGVHLGPIDPDDLDRRSASAKPCWTRIQDSKTLDKKVLFT